MKTLLWILSLVGLGACVSAPDPAPLEVPLELPRAASPALMATVTQVIDRRPDALRHSRSPHIESRYSVLIIGSGGVFVDGSRVEGPTHHGDETLRLVAGGVRKTPVEAVGELVLALAGGGGALVTIDPSLSRDGLERLIAGLPKQDGWVLVPFLDQLDVSALSSKNTMVGGSSTETGRSPTTVTTTTTSGAASLSARVGTFANARVRILAVEMRSGTATRRVWVHSRGVGRDLGAALAGLAQSLTEGLQELSR